MTKIPKLIVSKKPRSNFNLQRVNRITAAPGLAIPVLTEDVLPDDTFKLDIESLIKTMPMLSPVLGSFKVSFHMFFAPWRLYSKTLSSNAVRNRKGTGSLGVSTLPLPYFLLPNKVSDLATMERRGVAPGSLWDYLGYPVGFQNLNATGNLKFSGFPFLTYWDIIRNYFVHQECGYFAHYPGASSNPRPDGYGWTSTDLGKLDDFFEAVRATDGANIGTLWTTNTGTTFGLGGQFAGLACTTFMPDYFTNYLDNDLVARMNTTNRIIAEYDSDNSEYYLTMDQIRYGNKMQKYLETSLLGGSRYSDWIRSNWAVELQLDSVRPEYLGSTSTWCNFQDVVSTSNASNPSVGSGESGLGDLGGRGFGYGKGKRRAFHFKENGTFMVIMTLVPEVDYTQGIRKMHLKTNMSDTFVPALDGLGFQDISKSEYSVLGTGNTVASPFTWSNDPFKVSLGKQPAWMEYMTAYNEAHGELTTDLSYWILARDFKPKIISGSLTEPKFSPYVNPGDFNYLFVDTNPYAHNFVIQCKFDLLAKRQISKNIRPNLG